MVEFPILEEIKNFIYINIEYILLIVAPLITLILFLADKINKRIEASQDEMIELKTNIHNLIERFNKFELAISLEIERIKLRSTHTDTRFFKYKKDKEDRDIEEREKKNGLG